MFTGAHSAVICMEVGFDMYALCTGALQQHVMSRKAKQRPCELLFTVMQTWDVTAEGWVGS